jgi:CheY-like chemotaxis protein
MPSSGVRDQENKTPNSASRLKMGAPIGSERRKPLIVLADDSAIATMTMLNLLREAGFDVITTSNGEAALRAVQQHLPDLAILDVEMPEMSGTAACDLIKKDPKLHKVPVVLMTAHDDPKHLRDGFRAGCDGYISKGTEGAEIIRKIRLKLRHGVSLQSR